MSRVWRPLWSRIRKIENPWAKWGLAAVLGLVVVGFGAAVWLLQAQSENRALQWIEEHPDGQPMLREWVADWGGFIGMFLVAGIFFVGMKALEWHFKRFNGRYPQSPDVPAYSEQAQVEIAQLREQLKKTDDVAAELNAANARAERFQKDAAQLSNQLAATKPLTDWDRQQRENWKQYVYMRALDPEFLENETVFWFEVFSAIYLPIKITGAPGKLWRRNPDAAFGTTFLYENKSINVNPGGSAKFGISVNARKADLTPGKYQYRGSPEVCVFGETRIYDHSSWDTIAIWEVTADAALDN